MGELMQRGRERLLNGLMKKTEAYQNNTVCHYPFIVEVKNLYSLTVELVFMLRNQLDNCVCFSL